MWITQHMGDIIVILLLVAACSGILLSMIRNKKAGKSSCGCSCGSCSMACSCHKSEGDRGQTPVS